MPIYDFYCPDCGHEEKDVLRKFSDGPLICQHGEPFHPLPTPMEVKIGRTFAHFKGKGFPDKDRRDKRERLDRRNKRIEKMTPEQQEGFKRIIDKPGSFGERYVP